MKTELYKAIKSIDINNLTDEDKKELLRIFMATKNALIRNQIAFVFSDIQYNVAIPFIIKKISEKDVINNSASLIYSLQSMDVKKYFIEFIKIICQHEYESRLMAYEIVCNLFNSISARTKEKAIKILESCRISEEKSAIDKGENSKLHFIEKTEKLLESHTLT